MLVKFRDNTDIIFLEIDFFRVDREQLIIELYKYDLEADYMLVCSLKINYNTHSECISKIDKYQSGILDLTHYVYIQDSKIKTPEIE